MTASELLPAWPTGGEEVVDLGLGDRDLTVVAWALEEDEGEP